MATSKKSTGAMSKDRENKYVAAMDKQLKSRGANQVTVPALKRTKSYTTLPAKKKK